MSATSKTNIKKSANNQKHDIILYGATSFVGEITAAYLDKHIADETQSKDIKFAIAGRSESKLDKVASKLSNKKITKIIANATDEKSLRDMVKQTKVIISTVGPYDLYGSDLVKICAQEGVHYCDLAGESHWIKRMIDAHGDTAFKNGACIVNCCGFDSIPSDIGVYLLQKQAIQQFGMPCSEIAMRVKAAKGAMSGGTVASMVNLISKAKDDARLRKSLKNPYQICPSSLTEDSKTQQQTRQKNIQKPVYESAYDKWTAPFIMAAINTKIVHRSNALQGYAYAPDFKYDEAMFTGKGRKGRIKSYAVTAGIAALMVGAGFDKSRSLLEKYILPKPGEGPTQKQQDTGFYNILFYGKTNSGKQTVLKCIGDKDPGYGSTAKMLAQSAICLLQDLPADQKGGFWTPASLMGDQLVGRLEKYAGVTFEVV